MNANWNIKYYNDTGPGDEGFWVWLEVTNGDQYYKCDNQKHAQWLCEFLNQHESPTNETNQ